MYHVYQNQAAALYSSFYFFIFLSLQFSTLKFFITLLSETVIPRRLKLGTHIDSGQMYHVYQNGAAALNLPLIFRHFSSCPIFNIEIFRHTFLGKYEANKIETCYTHGQWADVSCLPESGYCCLFIPLFRHSSFSPIFNTEIFVILFSGTVRLRRLKLGTHMESGQMYHVYEIQASAAYSSLYFFHFSFSPIFNIEIFRHTFLGNYEA